MPVTRRMGRYTDDFLGNRIGSTTVVDPGGWIIKDTSAAGAPTYVGSASSAGGIFVMTLASTNEVENLTLYHGDKLCFDIDDLLTVEWVASVSGVDANTDLVLGMASAQNDAPDSVANNVWFRVVGPTSTSAVVVETDDALTDIDDIATGQSLSSVLRSFRISFENGKRDVRFFIDDVAVGRAQTFNMSNATGSLQPYAQLLKSSGTGVASLQIDSVDITFRKSFGS